MKLNAPRERRRLRDSRKRCYASRRPAPADVGLVCTFLYIWTKGLNGFESTGLCHVSLQFKLRKSLYNIQVL
jgi:hypothetical protein